MGDVLSSGHDWVNHRPEANQRAQPARLQQSPRGVAVNYLHPAGLLDGARHGPVDHVVHLPHFAAARRAGPHVAWPQPPAVEALAPLPLGPVRDYERSDLTQPQRFPGGPPSGKWEGGREDSGYGPVQSLPV